MLLLYEYISPSVQVFKHRQAVNKGTGAKIWLKREMAQAAREGKDLAEDTSTWQAVDQSERLQRRGSAESMVLHVVQDDGVLEKKVASVKRNITKSRTEEYVKEVGAEIPFAGSHDAFKMEAQGGQVWEWTLSWWVVQAGMAKHAIQVMLEVDEFIVLIILQRIQIGVLAEVGGQLNCFQIDEML